MLKIQNVCKTFGENSIEQKNVFDNFNLEIKKGEFVTIIGGNGAGKSTLMNLISGSVVPESGKIFINERDVTYMPEYKRAKFIGRVFQDPLRGTSPNLTIEENLSLAVLRGKNKSLKFGINKNNSDLFKEKLKELCLGLEDRLNTKMGLLSGGQRQAITLLMAVLIKPKILLLDEHTAALDPSSSDKILCLTEQITNDEEITTLMITHNIEQALKLGTRTIMLKNGKLALDLDKNEKNNTNTYELQKEFQSIV